MYGGGVLTTANYQWPCRLCHTALRLSLKWIATESVSVIYRDTLVALRSPSVQMKQIAIPGKTNSEGTACTPSKLSFSRSYQPQIRENAETHCAGERFQVTLCLSIAVTQGEISGVDLKSAGKSAGQFNGHCFTQGDAFRGWKLFFPPVMPALH